MVLVVIPVSCSFALEAPRRIFRVFIYRPQATLQALPVLPWNERAVAHFRAAMEDQTVCACELAWPMASSRCLCVIAILPTFD